MRPRWLDIGQVFLAPLWPETKSRSIKMQKKNDSSMRRSWLNQLLNKGFITWLKRELFCGTRAVP